MALYRTGLYVKNHSVEKVQVAKTPIASYNGNVTGLYIPELIAYIEAKQSGSGTPAPDNIRPISGVSECNVCNTPMPVSQLWTIDSSFNGVVNYNQQVQNGNFADGTTGWSALSPNQSSLSVVDNTLILTHTATSNRNYGISTSCAFVANHKYLIKGTAKKTMVDSDPDSRGFKLYCDTDLLKTYSASQNDVVTLDTIVLTLNSGTLFKISYLGGIGTPASDDSMMEVNNINVIDLTQMFGSTIADYIYALEQGEAGAGVAFFRSIYPNDYYAYDTGTDEMVGSREGNTYTIQLGDTCYGCSLDVTNGVLTVTRVEFLPTNTMTITGATRTNIGLWAFTINQSPQFKPNGEVLSSINVPTMYYFARTSGFCVASGGKVIFALTDEDSGLDASSTTEDIQVAFRSFVTTYAPQSVYELATPITVQLTPTQVEQLLGTNNVFADTGDVEVKFYNVIR